MAGNTGKGYRKGQVKDRYQVFNLLTDLWDKYDGSANYVGSKRTGGPFKGVEKRLAQKPPRKS